MRPKFKKCFSVKPSTACLLYNETENVFLEFVNLTAYDGKINFYHSSTKNSFIADENMLTLCKL